MNTAENYQLFIKEQITQKETLEKDSPARTRSEVRNQLRMSRGVRAHPVTPGKEKLYLVLSSLPPSKPQKLFVLPWNEVDCCIFQQSSKDKEKAHSHPNVNSFYIGDLERHRTQHVISQTKLKVFISWFVFWFINLLADNKYIIQLLMKMSVHKECTNQLLPLDKDQNYFNKIQVFL